MSTRKAIALIIAAFLLVVASILIGAYVKPDRSGVFYSSAYVEPPEGKWHVYLIVDGDVRGRFIYDDQPDALTDILNDQKCIQYITTNYPIDIDVPLIGIVEGGR